MRTKLENSFFHSFLAQFVIFDCLLYSPFVFFAFLNETLRLTIFGILFLLLLSIVLLLKYKKNDVLTFLFSCIFLLIYFLGALYANKNPEGIRSAIGYSLILAFSFLLFILSEKISVFTKRLIRIYVYFFTIAILSMAINFLLNLISPSINSLTSFFPNKFDYDYNASPFGLSISKYFLGINISRNFFFFVEPVYTAPFFLLNILMCQNFKIFRTKFFFILNIVGGVLSFSFLFFAGIVLLYINSFKTVFRYIFFIILMIFSVYIFTNIGDENLLFASTSSSDRLDRIQLALGLLPQFSLTNIVFGGGYLLTQNLVKGISSGLFSSVIEGGIIGLIIPFFFMLIYIKNNNSILIICIISLLTVEVFKMPLFWVAIILCGNVLKNKTDFILK